MSISPPSTPKSSSIMIPPANTKFNQSGAEAPFDHPLITDSQLSSSVESIPLCTPVSATHISETTTSHVMARSTKAHYQLPSQPSSSPSDRPATAVTNMHIPKGLLTPKSMPHLMFEDPATLPWPSKPPVPPKPPPGLSKHHSGNATTTPSIPGLITFGSCAFGMHWCFPSSCLFYMP
ncbi:hypothetical protein BD779DRAFT_778309 [Infundibulicybe gibba]|nr:hypothetical protein BD779DRAFT_778309 [Infundibulicybe gibba]